ncbi:salivary glue protein Sgs-3-like [Zophobas morio]|uniref:salivary glue protein Sgs-3-like n=1 Tax=Zophobas morio TaxID=2755281 RepID=UPI003083EDD1
MSSGTRRLRINSTDTRAPPTKPPATSGRAPATRPAPAPAAAAPPPTTQTTSSSTNTMDTPRTKTRMFADDTAFWTSHRDPERATSIIQEALRRYETWANN